MEEISYLSNILILLATSIFVVVLLYKIKTSPVIGYLVAGAIIGASGFIKDTTQTHQLAEFGVVFLLFSIGLELSFDRLIKMRLHVFGFGGLQLLLTSSIIAFILKKFFHFPTSNAVVIGIALSLSSTAVVLQVLSESGRQSGQVGRMSLSALLMQDFAVVPLLAVLPLLAHNSDNIMKAIAIDSLKALLVIIFITIFARLFLRPFFSLIASIKTEEVYVTTALFIVLGTAWSTSMLGLSSAMGAFIAGILIAETEYRNKIESVIHPFQGLFMALFFLSVGMMIDLTFIQENFKRVIIAAFTLIAIKASIILLLCKLFKMRWGAALHSALLLSQGSEFAFIFFNLAAKQGIIKGPTSEFGFMAVALSMGVTPLLSLLGTYIEDKIDCTEKLNSNKEFIGINDLGGHVIIGGFGRVGKIVAYMLEKAQINYLAIESNASIVKEAKKRGYPVFQGEISDTDILEASAIRRAAAIILTMSEKVTLRKTTKKVANDYKNLSVISRSEDYKHGKDLRKLGAESAIPERVEVGLQLGGITLSNLGSASHDILNIKEEIRKNNYIKMENLFKKS